MIENNTIYLYHTRDYYFIHTLGDNLAIFKFNLYLIQIAVITFMALLNYNGKFCNNCLCNIYGFTIKCMTFVIHVLINKIVNLYICVHNCHIISKYGPI